MGRRREASARSARGGRVVSHCGAGAVVRRLVLEALKVGEHLAAQLRVRHVDERRVSRQSRKRLALLQRLAGLQLVDRGAELPPELSWRARGAVAVDHETCHALPPAGAVNAGLLFLDLE